MIKKHLEGGTLKQVMVREVIRVLEKYQGDPQAILKASLELGTTPKTLRQWKGPVDKGGWSELQPTIKGSVEKVLAVAKKSTKKPTKKTKKKMC